MRVLYIVVIYLFSVVNFGVPDMDGYGLCAVRDVMWRCINGGGSDSYLVVEALVSFCFETDAVDLGTGRGGIWQSMCVCEMVWLFRVKLVG